MDDFRCELNRPNPDPTKAGILPEYSILTTFSQHAKKNIYGAAMKKWSSFAVKSPTEIVHEASHPMNHDRKFRKDLFQSF